MPNNIPFIFPTTKSGDFPPTDPILLRNLQNGEQQGFGQVQTMINPFFVQGFLPVNTPVGTFNYFFATASAQSFLEVSDYNNYTFQAYASGSGTSTITVTSTIDGVHYNPEFTFTGALGSGSLFTYSSATSASYRRRYFVASASLAGNATASLYMIAGQ